MVYDITNRNSFNSLKDYWYNAVKEYGPQGIIFHVAGNKIDLFEEEEVDRNDVKEYCESIDCEYSFISATENTFIDELFKKIGEKFLNSDIYKNLEQNKKNNKSQIFAIEDDEEDKKNSKNKNKKKKCC